mmetsp:Transcript_4336/g.7609  ORF Transcript_4336/g.7609 Transcript_4336/m.7609 type:complete len:217 (+) Transcript_4336:1870-2520(+)
MKMNHLHRFRGRFTSVVQQSVHAECSRLRLQSNYPKHLHFSAAFSSNSTSIPSHVFSSRSIHAAVTNKDITKHGDIDPEYSDSDFLPKPKQQQQPPSPSSSIFDRIQSDISKDTVVLYMKGLPSGPQCGFSLRSVQVLRALGVQFRAFNVLANAELRDGIKEFTGWPTIPQLFIGGEFIGGCDIIEQMYKDGSLLDVLKKSGAALPSTESKATTTE